MMNSLAQSAAVWHIVSQHVVHSVVFVEHFGVGEHSTGDVVQREGADIRHSVQAGEVVSQTPFGPSA